MSDCTCDDLTDLEQFYGEHYDDCPRSLFLPDSVIAELEELARKRPNQASVWKIPALLATIRQLRQRLSA